MSYNSSPSYIIVNGDTLINFLFSTKTKAKQYARDNYPYHEWKLIPDYFIENYPNLVKDDLAKVVNVITINNIKPTEEKINNKIDSINRYYSNHQPWVINPHDYKKIYER